MKRSVIITICIWAINIVFWSRYYINPNDPNPIVKDDCTKGELYMTAKLIPVFDEFIMDCKAHGIDYDHAYCLKYLGFMQSSDANGYTDYTTHEIRIQHSLLKDPVGLKFVLYHEFGHWLGLRHSTGIMNESYSSCDSLVIGSKWNDLKEQYFNQLKN